MTVRTQKRDRLNPELLDSEPPNNPDAERGALGSILCKAEVIDDSPLTSEDFYDRRHGKLFGHFRAMRNGGTGGIDLVLVTDWLRKTGDLDFVGGEAGLAELLYSTPTAANIRYYEGIVLDLARRRRAIQAGVALVQAGYSDRGETAEIVSRASDELQGILASAGNGSALKPGKKGLSLPLPPEVSAKPFPVDTLPEPLSGLVRAGSKALGCDPSYIALPLLAGLASAVGATRRIRLKSDWVEPCVLWAAIVGESGTLKSPAMSLALEPLRRLQASTTSSM